ncbi:hypothetical protein SD427_14125 [Chryseobacterium sp. JJR-5R]|uniref:DUF7674 family protein n=1 Tax=Chryseobacterium sp. JJR-5R TaxID=3093923 RepID=UPI002A7579E2|nr:hypothetical protein [Chryseobacterium sp. JJR-5R]WPO81897.1 hypothetical protein SD427_14125 [Chryseobacterium sp. JJR-5R]
MDYLQTAREITNVIPEIRDEIKEVRIQNSYQVIELFTDKMKKMIRQNERNKLFKCLEKMGEMYRTGDTMVKNAIENSFIYSLDNCTAFCSKEYRDFIFSHLSHDLQSVYTKQIYSHNI